MMKTFLFIFVIIFSLALTGCAEDPNVTRFDTTGSSEKPENTEQPSEEVATTESGEQATETPDEQIQTQEVSTEAEPEENRETEIAPEEKIEDSNKQDEAQEETVEPTPEESKKTEAAPVETDAKPVLVEEETSNEVIESEKTEAPQVAQEKPTPEEINSKSDDLKVSSFSGNHLETKMSYNLIRGTAPKNTNSITINDFKLQKYLPGQTAWSYIASTSFKTLKKGDNNYVVKALDKDGKEIDSFSFTIKYGDVDSHALPNVGPNLWLTIIFALSLFGIFKAVKKFKWQ